MKTDFSHWPVVILRPPEVLTDAEFAAYLDWTYEHILGRRERYAMLLDNRVTRPIPPTQRRLLTDHMERTAELNRRYCAGSAMVFNSVVLRGVLTAILWMRKPQYPTEVFGTLEEALSWCQRQLQSGASAAVR